MSSAESRHEPVGMPVRGRVRRRAWRRVSHGLHLPATKSECGSPVRADGSATTLDRYRQRVSPLYPTLAGGIRDVDELRAWTLLLPAGAAFTHLTAAALRGWRLPLLPDYLPVFVALPNAVWRPRRKGLQVSRHTSEVAHGWLEGLPIADPAEVLLSAARHLGLIDLVVLCDSALHHRDVTIDQIRATSGLRRRGAPGLIAGTRLLVEYDGAHHRDARQYERDRARARQMQALGWVPYSYSATTVRRQPQLILRDADQALGRPDDPGRLDAWHPLIQDSTFTRTGMARLRGRLGLSRRDAR